MNKEFFKDGKILRIEKYSNYEIQLIEKDKIYYLYCPEDDYVINDYPDIESAVVALNIYWRISYKNFSCD